VFEQVGWKKLGIWTTNPVPKYHRRTDRMNDRDIDDSQWNSLFEMARDYPKIKHILDSFMNDLKQFVITKKVLPWKPDDDSSFYIDFKEK
jgi:hypothetical protein